VTKLDNEAAAKSVPEVQKELLDGRYKIKLRDELPYQQKIVKMAQEPVAFQLYKKRHFNTLGSKGDGAKKHHVKGDFKNDLLKIANARIIHKNKFKQVVDAAVDRGWALQNRIINLPPQEEKNMRLRLEEAVTFSKDTRSDRALRRSQLGSQGGSKHQSSRYSSQKEPDLIYKPSAFEGNVVYIYEDYEQRITPVELVKIIIALIDEDIQKQKQIDYQRMLVKKKELQRRREEALRNREKERRAVQAQWGGP